MNRKHMQSYQMLISIGRKHVHLTKKGTRERNVGNFKRRRETSGAEKPRHVNTPTQRKHN